MTTEIAQIQIRRDTAANWTAVNPILADGEFGKETDTGKIKLGNGSATWVSLGYQLAAGPTGPTGPSGAAGATGPAASPTETVNTVATSGSTQTIPDVTAATMNQITLSANCTFTFPTAAAGKSFLLALTQGTPGSFGATWPGTVKWSGATAPTLTTATGKTDVFTFVCLNGTNWLGFTGGLNF